MPLKKLFQKRNSLKEIQVVKLANEEIEKLQSSNGSPTKDEAFRMQSEKILKEASTGSKERTSSEESEDYASKYEYIEQEIGDCSVFEKDNVKTKRKGSLPKTFERTRSASYIERNHKLERQKGGRRKCLSESKDSDIDYDVEDYTKTLIQFKDKRLDDVIGRYINEVIQKSIITAVKSVNVEEIIENITNSRHSSLLNSPECPISEEKWPDSLADFVELNEKSRHEISEAREEVYLLNEETPEYAINSPENKSIRTISSDGYSSDCEEMVSLELEVVGDTNRELNESSKSEESTTLNKELPDEHSSCQDNKEKDKMLSNEVPQKDSQVDDKAQHEIFDTESGSKTNNTPEEAIQVEHTVQTDDEVLQMKSDDSENISEGSRLSTNYSKINQIVRLEVTTPDFERSLESDDGKLDDEPNLLMTSETDSLSPDVVSHQESNVAALHLVENIPKQQMSQGEEKKMNWKVGYLHVKLPHKTRSKGLKAWKKRCVSIQPDEFVHDPKNPSLMISVYSGESGSARKHGASFWKSISCQKAVIYRSCSRSHKYAFTISDENKVVIHLAADSEAASQGWMAAFRSILWPPSPVIQLEKMLNGKQFEISIIDNDFAFRAGLLGMYGYLTITQKKLILVHPQQGYVIQEWYLNTIDKFELMQQSKIEDVHKVLSMTTCSDSSTGKGDILMFCTEAIALLQAVASTVHQLLREHIKQEGGKYEKELAEMADWLAPSISQATDNTSPTEDYYKVPPRQVKSLLDIPNFIFDKPITPVPSESCSVGENMETAKFLATGKTNNTRSSQDSGISAVSEDYLNCSAASFVVGGGNSLGKSSDSELSDCYTPPRSPEVRTRQMKKSDQKQQDDASVQVT